MATLALRHLTVSQCRELASHLQTALPVDRLVHAVAAIDFACWFAAAELRDGVDLRRDADTAREHFKSIRETVDQLRGLLATERPLIETASLDWLQVDQLLAQVRRSTERELEVRPSRGSHRPAFGWRDRLVAVIYGAYPLGSAKRSRGGHFEQTVEIVLGYLGRDVENVHAIVLSALRRCPLPPYLVTMRDGVTLP